MDTVASIAPASLHARMGGPQSPLVLDVRAPAPFAAESRMIAGALHPEADAAAFAATNAAGRPVVAYCVHGHEVSQGVASALRNAGFQAAYLEGGRRG